MSNENASGLSTHLIIFRTPTAIHTAGNTIAIAFPSGFDFTNIVIGELTMKTGASTPPSTTEGLAATADATNWGAVFTDGACTAAKKCTLTLTAPTDGVGAHDVIINDYISIAYASTHSTNPSSTGSKAVTITSTADAGSIAVPIITNDQVTLDATVVPVITFTNDNSTLHFGNLSSAAPQFASTSTSGSASFATANTFSIATNATSGYTLTYAPAATLTSGTNTIAAVALTSSASGTAGTPQFGMTATYSGAGTLTSAYSRASNNWKFTTAGDTLVTLNAPTAGDTVAMGYLANISNVTPAGTYNQTNTWIATGNF